MNKRTCFFLYLLINSTRSFTQEHHHHHHLPRAIRPIVHSPEMNDLHLHIDIPDRPPNPEPHTPQQIKSLKIKVAAITAVITALISGGVTLYIALKNCK